MGAAFLTIKGTEYYLEWGEGLVPGHFTTIDHGVGFGAIDHNARPRLHPLSEETLEVGMVFNIEPAIYFNGECGMRHCEMVAVSEQGADVLTTFQNEVIRVVLL